MYMYTCICVYVYIRIYISPYQYIYIYIRARGTDPALREKTPPGNSGMGNFVFVRVSCGKQN